MSSKIIIHNDSLSDEKALLCVARVVADHKISSPCKKYCFVTTFVDAATKQKYIVNCFGEGDTHTFKVRKDE